MGWSVVVVVVVLTPGAFWRVEGFKDRVQEEVGGGGGPCAFRVLKDESFFR